MIAFGDEVGRERPSRACAAAASLIGETEIIDRLQKLDFRQSSGPKGLPGGGQKLRKEGGQNCRNPHETADAYSCASCFYCPANAFPIRLPSGFGVTTR